MKSLAGIASIVILSPFFASAASLSVTTANIFDPVPGTSADEATAAANTSYPGFSVQTIDDGATNGFVFGDYLRPGGSYTTINDQLLSLTGFSDPQGINSLVFFDINNYESGRVADQVTIYYSMSAATGNSLNSGDYIALNGGTPYTLPISSTTSNNAYTSGTTSDGVAYDILTNLGIPAGAQSVLFDFGPDRDHNGGPTSDGSDPNDYNVGAGFEEIQAFAPLPEPSTYALLAVGGLMLGGIGLRSRRA